MRQGITRVGMSNVGKSYWRRKFEAASYRTICCDDEIERRLKPFLEAKGFVGIHDVAKWMGQPFDPQYPENSALYLKFENEVMDETIDRLFRGQRLVIDTTGSVIYTDKRIQTLLRVHSTVVLLDTTEDAEKDLAKRYIEEPKPVIWGSGIYAPLPGEEPLQALCRCYPDLLSTRKEAYNNIAHVILDYDLFRSPGFRVKDFVRLIS